MKVGRATLVLVNDDLRRKAVRWCQKAPAGSRIEFRGPQRTLPQNAKMWALLSEVAEQLPWHGIKLSPDDYKLLFLDALSREVRMVPNLEGNGLVSLGRSSSELSVAEMADLITLIEAFGANHGVVFSV